MRQALSLVMFFRICRLSTHHIACVAYAQRKLSLGKIALLVFSVVQRPIFVTQSRDYRPFQIAVRLMIINNARIINK
jgi:hypothetical protein